MAMARWSTAGLLSLLIGAGIYPLSVWLNTITALLLGYSMPLPPDFFPRTLGRILVFVVAVVISAPLCEEVMFRGILQRAYERKGPWAGILASSLFFVVYHMRFQGLPACWSSPACRLPSESSNHHPMSRPPVFRCRPFPCSS